MKIVQAELFHVPALSILFNQYRQFYNCEADLVLSEQFLRDRLERGESTIFLAQDGESTHGFVQLYPSFCSVEACPIYVLYDLYVVESARGHGIGEALLNRARSLAEEKGVKRLDLLTAKDNHSAQALYRKVGYKLANENFDAYSLHL